VLKKQLRTQEWVEQMARTAGLLHAFATGNVALARTALVDCFAEPARARLIPRFAQVKAAAEKTGAIGASVSGAGPTVFALCEDASTATRVSGAMQRAFGKVESTSYVGRIDKLGARKVEQ
jgi:homoserine kinase